MANEKFAPTSLAIRKMRNFNVMSDTPVRIIEVKKKSGDTKFGAEAWKSDHSYIAGGNGNWWICSGNNLTGSYKAKHTTTMPPSSGTLNMYLGNGNSIHQQCCHEIFHSSFICNNSTLETTQMSLTGWMVTQTVGAFMLPNAALQYRRTDCWYMLEMWIILQRIKLIAKDVALI